MDYGIGIAIKDHLRGIAENIETAASNAPDYTDVLDRLVVAIAGQNAILMRLVAMQAFTFAMSTKEDEDRWTTGDVLEVINGLASRVVEVEEGE